MAPTEAQRSLIGPNGDPPIEHTELDYLTVNTSTDDPCGTSWSCCPGRTDPHDPKCPLTIINPKELAGAKKPAIWKVMPRWIVLTVGRVMTVGAAKYGPFNYRDSTVSAMTYVDAIERHMELWQDGEDNDDESRVSHLAHVIAGCSILLDAQANGSLGDDRQKTGMARKTLEVHFARYLQDGDWDKRSVTRSCGSIESLEGKGRSCVRLGAGQVSADVDSRYFRL